MAGDWLPIRYTITDCPKVAKIGQLTNLDHDQVIGKLVRMWRWFGEHTTDGRAPVGAKYIDERVVFCIGFVGACCDETVRYLQVDGDWVCAIKWELWNASSAKARIKENERKRFERSKPCPVSVRKMSGKCPENVRDLSGKCPAKTGPEERREEKRREEKAATTKPPPVDVRESKAAAALVSVLRESGVSEAGIGMVLALIPMPDARFAQDWLAELRRRKAPNIAGMLVSAMRERWPIPRPDAHGDTEFDRTLAKLTRRRADLHSRILRGDRAAIAELKQLDESLEVNHVA